MAYDFNGTDQHLYAATAPATVVPLAISCWFKPDNTTSWGELVALSKSTGSDAANFFRLACFGNHPTADPLVAQAADSGGIGSAQSTANFSSGVWQHAFAVFASNTSRSVWLNGGSSATDTTSAAPSGVNRIAIGTKIRQVTPGYSGSFDGQIAEVAVWAGSGVENMGAQEAGVLALGISPRCLRSWLPRLVVYQDLIRPLNRPGDDFPLMAMNAPAVAAHPRMSHGGGRMLGLKPTGVLVPAFSSPFRLAVGGVSGRGALAGEFGVGGVEAGAAIPIGEVSG